MEEKKKLSYCEEFPDETPLMWAFLSYLDKVMLDKAYEEIEQIFDEVKKEI